MSGSYKPQPRPSEQARPAVAPLPEDQALKDFIREVLNENQAMARNLTSVQERSTELLLKARAWRKMIVDLGGADPGPP